MTLYLDTSSLIKLYVNEESSDDVRHLIEKSTTVVTSIVAYPEARSTLVTIDVDAGLCRTPGDLAERYNLRGFDSVHLACYLDARRRVDPEPVTFSCFDERLTRAARLASRALSKKAR